LLQDVDGLPLWVRSILTIYTVDSGSAPSWMRVWISGLPSLLLDSLDEDYIQENVMKTVRLFLDKQFNITEPISRFKSNWGSNQNFLGTYSFRKVITDEVDVWARDLEEPVLTLTSQKPVL
jgi:spermine oxidase